MLSLSWPVAAILGGFAGGALLAHQLQVRGLWATSQIVPDLGRLWRFSKGPGLQALVVQSVWSLAKGIILVAAAAWLLRAGWSDLLRQSSLDGPGLARAAGQIVLTVSWALAGVLLALGMVDFALRYRRFEMMLRTTPEEQREDQRVVEGDPAARAQRQRVARAMRGDSPEILAGSALLLCGSGGLTLVIAGGPPPRRVSVRSVAKGGTGLLLRRGPRPARHSPGRRRGPGPAACPQAGIRFSDRRRADRRARRDLARYANVKNAPKAHAPRRTLHIRSGHPA